MQQVAGQAESLKDNDAIIADVASVRKIRFSVGASPQSGEEAEIELNASEVITPGAVPGFTEGRAWRVTGYFRRVHSSETTSSSLYLRTARARGVRRAMPSQVTKAFPVDHNWRGN